MIGFGNAAYLSSNERIFKVVEKKGIKFKTKQTTKKERGLK